MVIVVVTKPLKNFGNCHMNLFLLLNVVVVVVVVVVSAVVVVVVVVVVTSPFHSSLPDTVVDVIVTKSNRHNKQIVT